MSRLDHERVMSILADVVELPPPRRRPFLDSTCLGEPELRREVEELLACADRASVVFDAASQQIAQPDPDHIGSYEILEPIGEGGMAIVYKAQQHHPVKRIVAVKLIKLGMDTRQFVARFESERQALAMMDHPNIAKVHDAGATELGRPYFVMEHVPGLPILEYCDEQNLSVSQRLELFIVVCEAVEHAHRKGIIHRDLKSSNVLITEVDGRPLPKVIDFGVAKAINQPLTDRTMFTQQGQLIGTPEYMSPEQAERGALDIDTRSDVYSLGVLLYEVIAGVQPIPSEVWRSGSFEQVQRIIRETEPARPSTRLSNLSGAEGTRIAERRRTALPALIRNLRSELEWIPLKALRKDREQRYRSAAELADDIRNYLEGRPLIAGPESGWYRTRKFLRRHKSGVAASAAMVLLLLCGVISTTWQAIRATRAQNATRLALVQVQQQKKQVEDASITVTDVNQFLLNMLAQADPYKSKGQKVTVQEALDAAAGKIGESLKRQPLSEAAIRTMLSSTYTQLGNPELGVQHAQAATDLRRRLLGNNHLDTLESINQLAFALKKLGRLAEAEPLYVEALEGCRRALGEDHPSTLTMKSNLAALLQTRGKLDESVRMLRDVLEKRRRLLGNDHPDTYQSFINLGSALQAQGKLAEAEDVDREAMGGPRAAAGDDHPDTLKLIYNLAMVLGLQGKPEEAEPLLRESLERSRQVLGDDHADTLVSVVALASLLHDRGKLDEAEPMYRQALEIGQRTIGPDHYNTLSFAHNLACLMEDQGKLDEAEASFRDVLERRRRTLGNDHPSALATRHHLASILTRRGQLASAETAWRDVAEARQRVLGPDHPDTVGSLFGLALVLRDEAKLSEAESVCADLVDRATRGLGETHPNALRTKGLFASVLQAEGKLPEAEGIYRTLLATRQETLGNEHPTTLGTLDNLVVTLRQQERLNEALPLSLELYERTGQISQEKIAAAVRGQYMSEYGICLAKLNQFEAAIKPLTEARAVLRESGDRNLSVTEGILSALVSSCDGANHPDEAAKFRIELRELQASTQPATVPR